MTPEDERRTREASDRDSGRWLMVVGVVGPILLLILTRAPILTSRHTYLDGDEALMGLMTQRAIDGHGLPLFPYGAAFGVSILESFTDLALASVFGPSELVLNVSIFLLWCAGVACLVGATRSFAGPGAAAWAALLAVMAPAWFHFSNVAWGYHHTAFLMSSAGLLAVSTLVDERGPAQTRVATLGVFASMTYYSHPIYALGLIPFMGWMVWRRRRVGDIAILAAVFGIFTATYLLVRDTDAFWAPTTFENVAVVESLRVMPWRIWVSTTGVYFLNEQLELGLLTRALAWCWSIMFLGALLHAAVRWARTRTFDLAAACLLSIGVVCAFSLIVDRFIWGFRYLVPIVAFQLILIAQAMAALERNARRFRIGLSMMALALGGLAVASSALEVSRNPAFSGSRVDASTVERDDMRELVTFFDQRGVANTYAWDGMLQWKLMFESRGRIAARWIYRVERLPEYPLAVDRAFRAGAPVALFGEVADLPDFRASAERAGVESEPEIVADRYFVILDPPLQLVSERFRLNE